MTAGEVAGLDAGVLVDRGDPMTGWRFWRVRDDGSLVAPYYGNVWQPGENRPSACWYWLTDVHPTPKCGCGIRAVTTLDALRDWYDYMYGLVGTPDASAAVWGQVNLYGRVCGPNGVDPEGTLRASHAELADQPLWFKGHDTDAGRALAERYGVEVEWPS